MCSEKEQVYHVRYSGYIGVLSVSFIYTEKNHTKVYICYIVNRNVLTLSFLWHVLDDVLSSSSCFLNKRTNHRLHHPDSCIEDKPSQAKPSQGKGNQQPARLQYGEMCSLPGGVPRRICTYFWNVKHWDSHLDKILWHSNNLKEIIFF